MNKINFIPPIVFEILKFKNPAIWLAESILAFFFADMQINRIIKVIIVNDLNAKNLYIKWLSFCKIQKTLFLGYFWAFSQKSDFFQKIRFRQIFNLKALKLHGKFQKNPISRFGENAFNYWPTDLLTYWYTDSGEIIGPLFTLRRGYKMF